MTSYIVPLIFTFTLGIYGVHGMDCSLGQSSNFVEKFISECPGILDPPSKSYCCIRHDQTFYCCNAEEFALKTGLAVILPAIIGVIVVVTFFVLCIACLCCSCCPWYKRRHRGTVYGKVHTPGVVLIQPGTTVIPNQPLQGHYPPYPQNTAAPPVYPSQPPPYTQQAPYNPNFS